MLTLGIDSGTQSTKTLVLEVETGKIIASAQAAYGLIEGLPPGHLEQDPRTWIEAVESTIAACLEKIGSRREEIVAIGVSGQQHGLVALDADGQPVRPAKLWCDTSTTAQCDQFAQAFGGAKGLIERAGNAILPGYTAPKILWLKQNEPDNFKASASFLLPHDYINFWLTGIQSMEFGDASGTGLMDVRQRCWNRELCEFIDPDLLSRLPAISSSAKPAGTLRAELCKKWGLKKNPVVSAGGGDNMMGAIGTGNIQAGVVTVSLGTSGTLYAFAEKPVVDPHGEVAAFCDSTDHWMPLVCTMNVTVATEQARSLFGWGVQEFDQAVASAKPGADGLLFLPYLNGERTPNLPGATGVFHGLTMKNMQPATMARATMEGVTLGLAYGLQRFRQLGIEPSEIRLTGGGSKSQVWRQLAADVFGVPTVCLTSSEGAALGAAVQGLWSAEGGDLKAVCGRLVTLDESTRARPVAENIGLYAKLLERQSALTATLHQAGAL